MDNTLSGRFQRAALGPRAVTAVVGIALLLAALRSGGAWWTALVAIVAMLCAWEFARMQALRPLQAAGFVALIAVLFSAFLIGNGLTLVVIGAIWLGLVAEKVFTRLGWPPPRPWPAHPQPEVDPPAWLLFGPTYLAVPTGVLARWRLELPAESILAFLLIIWANDTAAYFVGIAAGRHKLAPSISPGKSWEGAAAGTAAGALVAALAASWLGMTPGRAIVFGLLVTIASQIGDLLESAMKRRAGVKDSGTILPGHGGVLDRFDGILLAAPIAYFMVRLWGGR